MLGGTAAVVESARKQVTGLREINEAVITMDQGTRQNAAMVEEPTSASHSPANEVDTARPAARDVQDRRAVEDGSHSGVT